MTGVVVAAGAAGLLVAELRSDVTPTPTPPDMGTPEPTPTVDDERVETLYLPSIQRLAQPEA